MLRLGDRTDMGCFCHNAVGPLRLALPSLDASLTATLPNASLVLSLGNWLSTHGLPAAPWAPDPNWLSLSLPSVNVSASAMATLSAFAQLRAQVLAQFGIDLLQPGQARALARIVATLNARLSGMASINPSGWLQLAALNGAIDQVHLALNAGMLPPNPALLIGTPGGLPMADWRAFLNALLALLPLVAASIHLNLSLTENFAAQLSAALRVMAGIRLPALPAAQAMAQVTAGLSAAAQLSASLNVSPLQLGLPAVQAMVSARLTALLPQLSAAMRLNLNVPDPLTLLMSLLPRLPYSPAQIATAETVRLAASVNAGAMADWQVPALSAVPVLSIGLPVCSFTAQLSAALGIQAVLPAPCSAICDAGQLAAGLGGALSA